MILFENRRQQAAPYAGLWFEHPCEEVVCVNQESLYACLARLDKLRVDGYYLAGCLSYEAGYVLQGLTHLLASCDFPLLHFFAFEKVQPLVSAEVDALLGNDEVSVENLKLNLNGSEYADQFSAVKRHITAGDTYQVNLTARYQFDLNGSRRALYRLLRERQKVAYSAYLEMPGYEILSLSPELFFSKVKHKMHARPMKGTMPRSTDAISDEANRSFLKTDAKSRAENTMIVDLLRNDLSAISKPGSVKVPKLLNIESYETVHQMTSSIESEVDSDLSFSQIMQALFPCGSITGAPKRRTMEIIHDLEQVPRHVYTGAIGYMTPQNDMCFNVPIRTLLCRGSRGELGVGGGIVHDSRLDSEFEELQLKARFFTELSECMV